VSLQQRNELDVKKIACIDIDKKFTFITPVQAI
jgi:hypothetical protein